MVISLPAPKRSSKYYKADDSPLNTQNDDLPLNCPTPFSSTTAILLAGDPRPTRIKQEPADFDTVEEQLPYFNTSAPLKETGATYFSSEGLRDGSIQTTPARLQAFRYTSRLAEMKDSLANRWQTGFLPAAPKCWTRVDASLQDPLSRPGAASPRGEAGFSGSQRPPNVPRLADGSAHVAHGFFHRIVRCILPLLAVGTVLLVALLSTTPGASASMPSIALDSNITHVVGLVNQIHDKRCSLDANLFDTDPPGIRDNPIASPESREVLTDIRVHLRTRSLPSARLVMTKYSEQSYNSFMEDQGALYGLLESLQVCIGKWEHEVVDYLECVKRHRSAMETALYDSSKENNTFFTNLNDSAKQILQSFLDMEGVKNEREAAKQNRSRIEDWLTASANDGHTLEVAVDTLQWTERRIGVVLRAFQRFEEKGKRVRGDSTQPERSEWESHYVELMELLVEGFGDFWYSR